MARFEGYERRIEQIMAVLNSYGRSIQPICFENACWAYTVEAAIAIKLGCRKAADAAEIIGIGLQAFCIPGSVAESTNEVFCFFSRA